jgi:prepilin-type N-terminal cleavage/methylation domain-containing protein
VEIKMKKSAKNKGFTLLELLIAMMITLVLMGLATTLFARALGVRKRESRKADALTSARAALSSISREISNCGYGMTINLPTQKIKSNGIVVADSGDKKIRCRSNLNNNDSIDSEGEDITYFFDTATQSIVRYDSRAASPTSVIVNRISDVSFAYYD